MPQDEVAVIRISYMPTVLLLLACYVDRLWNMSGDLCDSSDDDEDDDDEDGDADMSGYLCDSSDNDDDEDDDDDDEDDDTDADADDTDDDDHIDFVNHDDDDDDDEPVLMDIYQRALHRMVSRFITTKPCPHLIARIASLTGLSVPFPL